MLRPRICPHCGTANEQDATFCGACATQMTSTSTALVPARRRSALPVLSQREKATLGSVALGIAAVALRVGATLLKQVAEKKRFPLSPSRPTRREDPPARRGGLRIRRRWVTGDQTGPRHWGEEEIEVDQPSDAFGNYRIWFGRK